MTTNESDCQVPDINYTDHWNIAYTKNSAENKCYKKQSMKAFTTHLSIHTVEKDFTCMLYFKEFTK